MEFGDVEFHDDRRAREALCAVVPPEIGASLANKATTKEAWDSIATVLKEQMARNGDTDITDARVVEKLLRCIPKKYSQIVLVIETLLDFETLSIEEVTGRIKVVQDREEVPHRAEHHRRQAALHHRAVVGLREEEGRGFQLWSAPRWRPRSGKKEEEKGPRAQAGADGGTAAERKVTRDDTCLYSGWTGHWAKDYHLPPCRGGQAHVAQAEEGDHTLFLVHRCVELRQEAEDHTLFLVHGYNLPQQLDENGSCVEIEHRILHIWDCHHRLLAKPVCFVARRDDDAWRWHERFGNLNFEALKLLDNKEMESFRAKQKLELVHADLCRPVTPATPGGWGYFLLLVDDMSHYMWVVLLDTKAVAADAIKRHQIATEKECSRKLRVLRMDNGGEFTAAEFAAYCTDEGIQCHYSALYTP
ncbi:uncharacterized protein [Miscanthus floridulus]|uniref:uncharacterized protein n=1 Tax=Miscanthus floridulus TaxID=154761 RepID=UPI003457D797